MRIGFIVDHPKRDLPGGVMLAAALARRGVETALIPMYEQAVDVPLLGLDALIINFARLSNLELVRVYVRAKIPIWVLDTEGGVLADDGANSPEKMAQFVRDSGFCSLLSGYFFWGDNLHRAFVKNSGMREDQLHVTGCPRFDFAAPCWRDILGFTRRGYILINANFPLVNPRFVRSAEVELNALTANGWSADYIQRLIADSRYILGRYLQTVHNLAKKLPNRLFLIRPHPFEDQQLYVNSFRELKNVVVDGAGGVLNVIRHADCVLHLNCGTSIEAILLGKVPLSLEFLSTDLMSQHSSLPTKVSMSIQSELSLFSAIENLTTVQSNFPFDLRHAELIYPWFHKNDGKSSDRIADIVVSYLIKSVPQPGEISIRNSFKSCWDRPRIIQKTQAFISNIIGSRAAANIRAFIQPKRRDKLIDAVVTSKDFVAVGRHIAGLDGFEIRQARNPITGLSLATLIADNRLNKK